MIIIKVDYVIYKVAIGGKWDGSKKNGTNVWRNAACWEDKDGRAEVT